jgi:hypothetical protein
MKTQSTAVKKDSLPELAIIAPKVVKRKKPVDP